MKKQFFDVPKVQIDKPIRLIELFGGIGTQAMALRDIGADFERHRLVEFDKYAVAGYNAIHGTDFKTTDIRDVHGDDLGITDKDKYCYLLTYSFPCQSLSVAGKMAGMSRTDWEEGKSTRSGLLWEVERILRELPQECLPDILVMENVTQIHNSKNAGDFNLWCEFLSSKGYVNHWKDLNGQDYGIPQHRERCFMVSILPDTFVDYEFPKSIHLEKVMKDFLKDDVDEKYYINSEKANKLIADLVARGELPEQRTKNKEQRTVDLCLARPGQISVANCIAARCDRGISNRRSEGSGVVDMYNKRRINGDTCGTITANGNTSSTHCGTFGIIKKVGQISSDGSQCGTVVSEEGLSPTLTAGTHGYANPHVATSYRIRKLTPRECYRLMGFSDEDFDRAASVISNTQLYKTAGNAIVKQVLMAIFSQMNIKGVKPWNEMTSEEKYKLIRKSTSEEKIKRTWG